MISACAGLSYQLWVVSTNLFPGSVADGHCFFKNRNICNQRKRLSYFYAILNKYHHIGLFVMQIKVYV